MALCLLAACARTPEPIQYGRDACTHCRMTIMDKRFAAEIITAKGKILKFDAAECMAGYLKENPEIASNKESIFLICDFDRPGRLVDARKSFFLNDASLSSPMGAHLAAFADKSSAVRSEKDKAAAIFNWEQLLKR